MRHGRKDNNHASIVEALESVGAFVADTSAFGDGFPDLVFAFRGAWHVADCKNLGSWYGRKGLNELQKAWSRKALACGASVLVFTSPDDALRQIGVLE